jgi:CheY-like chemotaxis protein
VTRKKILIIHDQDDLWEIFRRSFRDYDVQFAGDTSKGQRLALGNLDADAMVVDGHMPLGDPKPLKGVSCNVDLVREIRSAGYVGLMIAASADDRIREQLVEAGCDHEVKMAYELPRVLSELLVVKMDSSRS